MSEGRSGFDQYQKGTESEIRVCKKDMEEEGVCLWSGLIAPFIAKRGEGPLAWHDNLTSTSFQ